jgi:2-oxoglutarate ferredoxin oxidoreductase subunit beta
MATEQIDIKLNLKDWTPTDAGKNPTWCPGCGDFGVLKATKEGLVLGQYLVENTVVVSGIGCSSNFPHFTAGYGVHSLHGRANPVAEGIKLSNPDLNVIVTGGDGDGLAIGIGGFIHAARRNVDVAYIIMDNQVYGLTVNQASPTSSIGRITRSTPHGNIEQPLNPVAMAFAAGATFIARTFSSDWRHFSEIVKAAIDHKGFAFIDALSPCVTFNKENTVEFWRDRVYKLENDPSYDRTNFNQAAMKVHEFGPKVPIGIFYQNENIPTYHEADPTYQKFGSVVKRGAHKLSVEARNKIMDDFK